MDAILPANTAMLAKHATAMGTITGKLYKNLLVIHLSSKAITNSILK
jgi:hypothetical protein